VPTHLRDGVEDAVDDGVEDAVSNTVDDAIRDDNRVVTLEIIDNGVGLAADYPQDHLGMVVVESLAQQLEATFSLSNLPAGGCLAQVCFKKRSVRLK
jgi:nitrate/nitrite-specific signal transduction histidine kinase